MQEVVRFHSISKNIVTDKDPISTSNFWQSLQRTLGVELSLSTAYHPQTDGQIEMVNRVLEDLLRAYVIDFGGSLVDHLHLMEFTYNITFQSAIGMAPFEDLYGRPCNTPSCWWKAEEQLLLGSDMIKETLEKIDIT